MADIFRISDGTNILSLRQATVFLLLDTWRTAPAGGGKMMETFQVGFTGTDAAVKANIELLLMFNMRVRNYFENPVEDKPVFLEIAPDGITEQRGLIYDISSIPVEEATLTPLLGKGASVYQVAILRDEEWEFQDKVTTTINNIDCGGGKYAFSLETYGSVNSRISAIQFSGGPATALYRVWLGIQPYLFGNTYDLINSYFDGSWQAEAGTAVLGGFVNDATASPAGTSSNCLEVTSVPSTLGKAWWSKIADHAGARHYLYAGDWFVLARIKLNSGTVAVQMRSGTGASSTDALAQEKAHEISYVSNTGWRLIELGKVSFPPYGYHGEGPDLSYNFLSLYIQQASGTTTSFKLDEVILIPARHFIKAYKTKVDNAGNSITFHTRQDGSHVCVQDNWTSQPEATFIDWGFPYTGGFIVAAAEAENAHTLTDNMDLAMARLDHFLGFGS